jgi:ATP-binding protein involved in chromosome partitioning
LFDNKYQVTEKQIFEILRGIKYPGFSRDIVSFGLIKGVEIVGKSVIVKATVNTRDESISQKVEEIIIDALQGLKGIDEVRVEMTSTRPQPPPDPHARPEPTEPILPRVKFKIAIASGKGGVGKSTVAAGLALILQKQGLKVGLVDFDIYGPSIPTLLGIQDRPLVEGNRIIPLDCSGMKVMSMGFLVDADTPMIWRGPMVHQATEQFLRDVDWGELDILIVDLPPGTGDAQMTLSQKIKLDGAVIVSTPQHLALGIVENMSGFTCPNCGHTTHIFGHGGAAAEAAQLGVPLLASLPLVPELVIAADNGTPFETIESNPALSTAYTQMANAILQRIELKVEVS